MVELPSSSLEILKKFPMHPSLLHEGRGHGMLASGTSTFLRIDSLMVGMSLAHTNLEGGERREGLGFEEGRKGMGLTLL